MPIKNRGGFKRRLAASVALTILAVLVSNIWYPTSFIGSAIVAGQQLQNSNAGAIEAHSGANFFRYAGSIGYLILIALLALIWIPYIKNKLKALSAIGTFIAFSLANGHSAYAYWSTANASEPLGIPTNSTAFWKPNIGDTQSGQQQTDDAAFYNSHTVPGKIFVIHPVIFSEPGIFSQDYYVSPGQLILVDRTPVSREWTSSSSTGTSAGNESYTCQSNNGLNVKEIGVSISAFIQPQDAATYLYYYGTVPVKPDPNDDYMTKYGASDPNGVNDPNVIFASELHATPLDYIMDTKIHSFVGLQICNAIGEHDLNTDNLDYVSMMADIQKSVAVYLATRGITLDYMGWDGTWTFDDDVQQAENNVYVAQETQPYLDVLRQSAEITAIQKWNGGLPNSMTLVGGLSDIFGGIFSSKPTATK